MPDRVFFLFQNPIFDIYCNAN